MKGCFFFFFFFSMICCFFLEFFFFKGLDVWMFLFGLCFFFCLKVFLCVCFKRFVSVLGLRKRLVLEIFVDLFYFSGLWGFLYANQLPKPQPPAWTLKRTQRRLRKPYRKLTNKNHDNSKKRNTHEFQPPPPPSSSTGIPQKKPSNHDP